MPQARPCRIIQLFVSGRLFASNIHAPACMFRQSPNASGRSVILPDLGVFIFKTTSFANALRLLCDVFLDFPSARLTAAERRYMVAQSAKPSFASIVSHIIRAGCLPATYTLPRVCFGKARTPTEARRAAPRLGLYTQDNDVHGGVRKRAAALHRFLGLSLRSAHGRRASIYGRSVGKAILRFHSEPYVTLHPRRGFAYIRHILLRDKNANFFNSAAFYKL